MVAQLGKKPQQIGLVVGGVAQTAGGTPVWTPAFQSDGATFQLQAAYLDHLDMATSNLFPSGTVLTHATSPILYRAANDSGIVQVGPDTFRVQLRDGPSAPQGNPWEPTLVAYSVGDSAYRPTERPVHVNITVVNTAGKAQTINFPTIADRKVGTLAAIVSRFNDAGGQRDDGRGRTAASSGMAPLTLGNGACSTARGHCGGSSAPPTGVGTLHAWRTMTRPRPRGMRRSPNRFGVNAQPGSSAALSSASG